jgi:hypothetical protein
MDEQHTKTVTQSIDLGLSVSKSVPAVTDSTKPVQPVKKRGGRPKKADIEAKLKPGKRGRPKGDYTLARELCARMLVANSDRMLQEVMRLALTDGHPSQIAALKMVLDRALPISYFESKEPGQNGGQGVIINITGLAPPQVQSSQESDDNIVDIEVSDGKD